MGCCGGRELQGVNVSLNRGSDSTGRSGAQFVGDCRRSETEGDG